MSYGVELDQEAFCSWLCAHEDAVVGSGGTCFQSPLAQWLSEMSGSVYGVDGMVYGRASWEYRAWLWLPQWAQLFTARLEKRAFHVLTGDEALSILAEVERALLPVGAHRQAICHARLAVKEVPPLWRSAGSCGSDTSPASEFF